MGLLQNAQLLSQLHHATKGTVDPLGQIDHTFGSKERLKAVVAHKLVGQRLLKIKQSAVVFDNNEYRAIGSNATLDVVNQRRQSLPNDLVFYVLGERLNVTVVNKFNFVTGNFLFDFCQDRLSNAIVQRHDWRIANTRIESWLNVEVINNV